VYSRNSGGFFIDKGNICLIPYWDEKYDKQQKKNQAQNGQDDDSYYL